MNAGDVARGFRECARELLQGGVAVQFERIEIIPPRFDILVPMQYLRFGLDFQAAQLLLQARHGSRQLGQIEIDRIDLLIEAGAKDADLAGIVEHGVEQVGIHARHFHPLHRRRLAARQYRRAAQFQARRSVLVRRRRLRRNFRRSCARGSGQAVRGPQAAPRPAARRPVRTMAPRAASAFGAAAAGATARRGGRLIREAAYLRNQVARIARQRAGADQIAHAREFIQAGLHDRVSMVVARDRAAVDLQHQGLELVTQVAHGGNARHSRAALQRVQLTLQLGDRLLVLAVLVPNRQRALSRFQQLGRLLAVDIRDFVIEFFRRRRCRGRRRRGGLLQRGGSASAGTMAEALVSRAALAIIASTSASRSRNRASSAG